MSNKFMNKQGDQTVHQRAVAEIQSVVALCGSLIQQPEVTSSLISLESLNGQDMAKIQSTRQEIEHKLREQATFAGILAKLPTTQQEIAIEAATMTIMAAGNPAAWAGAAPTGNAPQGTVTVNPNQGTAEYRQDFSMEGFDSASANQFIAHSAYVNAMVAVQGGFEEAFFPIQIIPANGNGIDVSISVPKVYRAGLRSSAGTAYSIEKTNIIKGLVDSTVLENNVTKIVPNMTYASAVMLANASSGALTTWPQTSVLVNNEAIDTNPLKLGTEIDLIGSSQYSAIVNLQNETDTLDSVINVGSLMAAVTITDGTTPVVAKFKADVSSQKGSLLQRAAQDTDRLFITTFKAKLVLTPTYTPYGASGAETTVASYMATGGAAKIVMEVLISAQADTERGNMTVTAATPSFKYYDVDGTELTALAGTIAITNTTTATGIIGYTPQARRTNSNFRSRGTIIDSTTVINYRFPVPLQSPFISQNPIGGQVNTSIEGLAHAERIRNNNNAVKALLALEEVLAADNGLPVNSPAMAVELSIQPTYVTHTVDLEGVVVSLASKDSVDNLRGAFTAAIRVVVDKMIQMSNYLAALEFFVGNNNDYEVILVTDSRIYPWLMENGDSRTLGANTKFKITQSLNSSIKDKIYISLRRATRDGQVSPLDFGFFAYTPALTHTVQVSRNNGTTQEIHTVPRNAYYTTLPILGVIEVENMVELFVDAA